MTLWMVRAGRAGEREALALEKNLAVIGWEELPDLSKVKTRDVLTKLLAETYPNEKPKTLMNWESQIWPMLDTIKTGDLIALPLKTRSTIAVGHVTGPYKYNKEIAGGPFHTRPVKWIKELPRSAFDQDLLYSLGAFMTVCRIQRNNAEDRIKALLSGKPASIVAQSLDKEVSTDATTAPDLEQYSHDLISSHLSQKFKGHALTSLVAAVLTAQGYQVRQSPEGPDGGVDIIAGHGALGFDAPRLVVQVKSQDTPVDVNVLRELQGVMKNFQAQHGLLVAWGGYNKSAAKEAARLFFEIRLWDAGDIVRMVQEHYEQLPEAIQAELPLKRIWALAIDEEA